MFLALALTGCAQDAFDEQFPAEGTEISFIVQREPDAITRAALADGNSIAFEAGDRISIFDGAYNNCEFTQHGEIGTDGSATFTGKVKNVADSYYALYPYMPDVEFDTGSNKIGSTLGENRHPVIIPEQQKAVAGSFDPQAFISVASSTKVSNSEHSVTFRNICALVKFTVPESVGDFTFEKAVIESGTRVIAGACQANPDGSANYIGPGSHTVTLTGTMKAGESYYFCTYPMDGVKGLSISLYHYPDDENPVVVKASAADKDAPLVRNRILNLGEIAPAELPSKAKGWYGDGTEANPFQISTKEDMSRMLGSVADSATYRASCFRLTDDIDAGGESFIADGRQIQFNGVFDGNGHVLSNYLPSTYEWYDQGTNQYSGIFHKVKGATFKNLTLVPSQSIQADFSSYSDVSFFIAKAEEASNRTLIENCRIQGNVNVAMSAYEWSNIRFAGFVGNNAANALDFVNCTNDVDLSFSEYTHTEYDEEWHAFEHYWDDNLNFEIGGFVGHMYCGGKNATTTFDRCRNSGDISLIRQLTGGNIHCGGFIARGGYAFIYPSTFTFTNCVNSGDITISVGNGNASTYGSGFVGFNQVDGLNHSSAGYDVQRLAVPHYYNCLNKGNISVNGNSAHAAGFAFFSKPSGTYNDGTGNENNQYFALCVNIGDITATGTTTYKAAISSGYGKCTWCWWLEADKDNPVLGPTLNGLPTAKSDGPYYCYCYPTINAGTPNNRRVGSDGNGGTDIVLDLSNTMWSNAQWKANTVAWKGGSRDKSLDLDF